MERGECNRYFLLVVDESQMNRQGDVPAAHCVRNIQPVGNALHMVVDSEWIPDDRAAGGQ